MKELLTGVLTGIVLILVLGAGIVVGAVVVCLKPTVRISVFLPLTSDAPAKASIRPPQVMRTTADEKAERIKTLERRIAEIEKQRIPAPTPTPCPDNDGFTYPNGSPDEGFAYPNGHP